MSGPVLDEATIDSVHEGYRNGSLSCSRLVEFYLQRVKRFDLRTGGRPPLNSIVSIAPDVREQAARCDRELAVVGVSKPLQGIPVWVKDNISVAGLAASAGLLDFTDAVAREDAALVANLRRAGAVIMGTASMTGLGIGTDAWGSRFGRAGNVYDTREEPGGSSHGPAIATSANFGMVAAGVDDCCSIILPAALNGAVGLRPTVGRVPREGVVVACTDTSPGPIARTVADLGRVLEAMGAGPPETSQRVAGRRIGVLVRAGSAAFSAPEDMRVPFEQALRDLQSLGATVVPDVHLKGVRMSRLSSLAYHNALVEHLKARSAPPTTMRELFKLGLLAPGALHDIGKAPVVALWPNVRLPDVFAPWYRRIIRDNQRALGHELDQQGLDALVFLSLPAHGTLATVTQAPQLTVPAGTFRGAGTGTELPVGLSFLGRPWDEATLLGLAGAYESRTRHRRSPRFQEEPSADERLDVAQFNAVKLAVAHRVRDTMRLRSRTDAPLSPEEFTTTVDGVKKELGFRD
ncbi:amidase family protein [Stigmatella erecta]|uniref:Amidase n=1 Tax=Stigmatella erecta TaxID=83460 RepID=A0A1I0ACW6_9BACT|nr:amidase family protein [Stigmatella erecta]SES91116.1 amidase [Stigmatella erecta]